MLNRFIVVDRKGDEMNDYKKKLAFSLLNEAEEKLNQLKPEEKLLMWPSILRLNILIGNMREFYATQKIDS